MFRQFLTDSATYGLANVLTRGVGLIILPLYTRVLVPADYGALDLLIVFSSLVYWTVSLMINEGLARFYPDTQDPNVRLEYASSAFWFTVATFTVFALIALVLAGDISERLLGTRDLQTSVQVAVLSFWAGGPFLLVQNQLRWELRPRAYAAISVASTLAGVVAGLIFVFGASAGVVGVLAGQLISNLLGLLLALAATRSTFSGRPRVDRLVELLRFSSPLVLSALGAFGALYVDRVLINTFLTRADVGIFGIGARLTSVLTLLVLPAQAAITPLVYSRHREPGTPEALARIFRHFVGIAILAWLMLALFADAILRIVTTPEYLGAASVVPYLAGAFLFAAVSVFAPGLAIARRTGVLAAINISGGILITVLNLVLIPRMGIVGAAIADLVGSASLFAILVITGQGLYRIPHSWARMAFAVGAAVVAWLAGSSIDAGVVMDVILKLVIILGMVAALITLGLIEPATLARVGHLVRLTHRDRLP